MPITHPVMPRFARGVRTSARDPQLLRLWIVGAPVALFIAHLVLARARLTEAYGFANFRRVPREIRHPLLGTAILIALVPSLRRACMHSVEAWGTRLTGTRRSARIALAVALFVGFRCQNFYLGDSADLVRNIASGYWLTWREPIAIAIQAGAYRLLASFFELESAEWSFVLTSTAAGSAYVFLPGRMARSLGLDGAARRLFVGAMLTCGAMQIFFGYAEVYALASLALVLFLASGLATLRGRHGVAAPACLLGFAGCVHPLTWFAGPSLAYLVWSVGGSGKRVRRIAIATCAFMLPIALVAAWLTLAGHGPSQLPTDKLGGADGRCFLPLLRTELETERTTLFSLRHARDVLNEVMLISPLALPLLATAFFRSRAAQSRPDRASRFLAIATLGLFLFAFAFNPDLGPVRDWDLFATLAFPLTAFAAYTFIQRVKGDDLTTAAFLYPFTSAVLSAAWIFSNTTRLNG